MPDHYLKDICFTYSQFMCVQWSRKHLVFMLICWFTRGGSRKVAKFRSESNTFHIKSKAIKMVSCKNLLPFEKRVATLLVYWAIFKTWWCDFCYLFIFWFIFLIMYEIFCEISPKVPFSQPSKVKNDYFFSSVYSWNS